MKLEMVPVIEQLNNLRELLPQLLDSDEAVKYHIRYLEGRTLDNWRGIERMALKKPELVPKIKLSFVDNNLKNLHFAIDEMPTDIVLKTRTLNAGLNFMRVNMSRGFPIYTQYSGFVLL